MPPSTVAMTSPSAVMLPDALQFLKLSLDAMQTRAAQAAAEVASIEGLPESLITSGPAKTYKEDMINIRNRRVVEMNALAEMVSNFLGMELVQFYGSSKEAWGTLTHEPLPSAPSYINDIDSGVDGLEFLKERYKARRASLQPHNPTGTAATALKQHILDSFSEQLKKLESMHSDMRSQVQQELVHFFANKSSPAGPRAVGR